MATATRRQTPPTHPTVWVGLGMATVGLLVALYSYTGSRTYDVTFAFVALVGGIIATGGILTAAWGRAVMTARASRSRRVVIKEDALKLTEEDGEQPPTVAEPASKRRLNLTAAASMFRFSRRPNTAAPAQPEAAGSPALEAALTALEAPPLERVTLKCPQCATQFASEGVRPFVATCPSCGFSADV
jgi:hypothetical protein